MRIGDRPLPRLLRRLILAPDLRKPRKKRCSGVYPSMVAPLPFSAFSIAM